MNKQNAQLRLLLLVVVTLVGILVLVPSFVDDLPDFWKAYLPSKRLNLGLDLRGGTHLLMNVETDKAIEHALERNADRLNAVFATNSLTGARAKFEAGKLVISSPTDAVPKVKDLLESGGFSDLKVEQSNAREGVTMMQLDFTAADKQAMREAAVDQSLETISNRINQFGVAEPIIQREGDDGILVQLPGIQDPQRAKELIGRTAVLELKLLPENASPEEFTSGGKTLSPDWEILEGIEVTTELDGRTRRDKTKYVVEKRTLLTGDTIINAQPRPGSTGLDNPYVEWELNAEGADQFEKITAANVGRRLAIVLDNTVYSAPVIKDRIPGGRAVIEGDFSLEEARDLAIVLRAGALPAPVNVAEERTVGPSLGQDSINQGVLSFVVGGLMVVIFMAIYYKGAGVLADFAVILNIILLLACLALFQATLTLPGIAGIVLTIGMAVDANVLINERMREELRLGKSARAAIEAGYDRALPAILDSNVTTFLSGVILFQFGSGPVKGFAVSLCVGILTTVFTAVVATRIVYDYLLATRRVQTVSV